MILNPRITIAVNNIANILINITKLFIIGLQICVIKLNGDRWEPLKKFSHMNINTPTTPIKKKIQDKAPPLDTSHDRDTSDEFLGDNYPHISQNV